MLNRHIYFFNISIEIVFSLNIWVLKIVFIFHTNITVTLNDITRLIYNKVSKYEYQNIHDKRKKNTKLNIFTIIKDETFIVIPLEVLKENNNNLILDNNLDETINLAYKGIQGI